MDKGPLVIAEEWCCVWIVMDEKKSNNGYNDSEKAFLGAS
jgi:hypothetical protein